MEGNNKSNNHGITQRGVKELFQQMENVQAQDKNKHYSVFVSFLQIYNEKVYDLLNPSSVQQFMDNKKNYSNFKDGGLRIRWTKKDQFVVENLYVFECQSPEEALELFKFGRKNRVLASHNLNELSSRSHTIFSITIEAQDIRGQSDVTVSKL